MRRVRLRSILTTLVLVTSVPLAVLAGWLTYTSGTQEQALIHAQNVEKARAVSAAIDLEVERTTGALVALSTLEPIDQANLQHFTEIAARLLHIHSSWQAVRLIDPQLHLVASTAPGMWSSATPRGFNGSSRPGAARSPPPAARPPPATGSSTSASP